MSESVCVCVCAAVLSSHSHKSSGSFLLCGSYFDVQHHIRDGTVDLKKGCVEITTCLGPE